MRSVLCIFLAVLAVVAVARTRTTQKQLHSAAAVVKPLEVTEVDSVDIVAGVDPWMAMCCTSDVWWCLSTLSRVRPNWCRSKHSMCSTSFIIMVVASRARVLLPSRWLTVSLAMTFLSGIKLLSVKSV